MLVRAKNPFSHRYVVAKGIIYSAICQGRILLSGAQSRNMSVASDSIEFSLVAISMRLSCSDMSKWTGGRA
jgi:hypothetical protein